MLTSSIFSFNVLLVSADYLNHLQPNEWDPFDRVCQSYMVEPQMGSDSALPED